MLLKILLSKPPVTRAVRVEVHVTLLRITAPNTPNQCHPPWPRVLPQGGPSKHVPPPPAPSAAVQDHHTLQALRRMYCRHGRVAGLGRGLNNRVGDAMASACMSRVEKSCRGGSLAALKAMVSCSRRNGGTWFGLLRAFSLEATGGLRVPNEKEPEALKARWSAICHPLESGT